MLDDRQVRLFDTLGFVLFRQLFSAEEIRTIGAEAAVAIAEIYHDREGGTRGRWVPSRDPLPPSMPRSCTTRGYTTRPRSSSTRTSSA